MTHLGSRYQMHNSITCMASQLFSVKRQRPELIVPARPTPREVKLLSDIDDQESLRFHIPLIFVYKNDPCMKRKEPVKVIREALSGALVFYYPLAGRLIERSVDRKLMVDCSGEGVLFVEADADFTLEQLGGDEIQPPFPCFDQLFYCGGSGSEGMLYCPLLIIQVTRLACGGVVVAMRLNHTICDTPGLIQFLNTVMEMAQGANEPSVLPVWRRELFNARDSPKITCTHHEYEGIDDQNEIDHPYDMHHKSFYFGPREITALRNHLPPYLKKCSAFDLLTACVWKCRTAALELDSDEIVKVSCVVGVRGKHYNTDLPIGYYGNAFALPAVCAKAGILSKKPLGYAVELVKKAKAKVDEEYIRSMVDLMVIRGRPKFSTPRNFIASDITRVGFSEIDFGWGKPVYAGTAGTISFVNFFTKHQKSDGENGILIPVQLPPSTMERFEEELKKMTREPVKDTNMTKPTEMCLSRL